MRSPPCLPSPRNQRCCRRVGAKLRERMNPPFQVDFFPFSLATFLTLPSLEYSISNPYPACQICFEPVQVTYSPVSAALAANSSGNLPFGLRLPCPGQHSYCTSCLVKYIKGKLNLSGTGDVNTHALVFPICCPGCPITQWETVIQDDVAEKVLDRETMSNWVSNL